MVWKESSRRGNLFFFTISITDLKKTLEWLETDEEDELCVAEVSELQGSLVWPVSQRGKRISRVVVFPCAFIHTTVNLEVLASYVTSNYHQSYTWIHKQQVIKLRPNHERHVRSYFTAEFMLSSISGLNNLSYHFIFISCFVHLLISIQFYFL